MHRPPKFCCSTRVVLSLAVLAIGAVWMIVHEVQAQFCIRVARFGGGGVVILSGGVVVTALLG